MAENVGYLKFTYDVNNNGVITAAQPSLPAGVTPNMITKVNIAHMSMRSQQIGTTAIRALIFRLPFSARNLTMGQEYPISGQQLLSSNSGKVPASCGHSAGWTAMMRRNMMLNTKFGSRGFTLIASLLYVVLLSGFALGSADDGEHRAACRRL